MIERCSNCGLDTRRNVEDGKHVYPNFRYSPDAEFRFFNCVPQGDFIFYRSMEEARDAAAAAIHDYLDGCWDEEVEHLLVGEISHTCEIVWKKERPKTLDADGCDEDGNSWPPDVDYMCDYGMVPVGDGKGPASDG